MFMAKSINRCAVASAVFFLLLNTSNAHRVTGKTTARRGLTYLGKFCAGVGTSTFISRFNTEMMDKGYSVHYIMDELWEEHNLATATCDDEQLKLMHNEHVNRGHLKWDMGGILNGAPNPETEFDFRKGFTGWHKASMHHGIRAHYWYAVLVNCKAKEEVRNTRVKYDLIWVNKGPELTPESIFAVLAEASHFSEDDAGMFSWTICCFVLSSIAAVFIFQLLRSHHKGGGGKGHFHPIIEALVLALVLQYISMLLLLLHYWAYSSNGMGWNFLPIHSLSTLLHEAVKIIVTALCIVISQGWTITTDTVPNSGTLFTIGALSFVAEFAGKLIQMVYAESHDAYSSRAREGFTGIFFVVLQLGLFAWFLKGVMDCIGVESKRMSERYSFFVTFAGAASVWFLVEPILVIVSTVVANYWRQRVLAGGSLIVQTAALLALARLFLSRSSGYYKISALSDSLLPSANDRRSL